VVQTAAPSAIGRQALRWKGDDSKLICTDELRPGDTLIVPTSYGGCDSFGWNPQFADPTEDLADSAATRRRSSPVMRIHPSLMQDGGVHAALRTLLDAIEGDEPREFIADSVKACLNAIMVSPSTSKPQRDATQALIDARFNWKLYQSGDGLLIEARHSIESGDEDETVCMGRPITLATHSEGVRDYAGQFAGAVGLPAHLVEDEKLAGWLHDLGKADPRCQIMLHRGARARFSPPPKSSPNLAWTGVTTAPGKPPASFQVIPTAPAMSAYQSHCSPATRRCSREPTIPIWCCT
jgi:CRISPR-associated endonuclease/helicase Cas3